MEIETSPRHPSPDAWNSPQGWSCHASVHTATPDATLALARRLSDFTRPGDALLLSGALGAGKSHFARGFIRHALGAEGASTDAPSPTFTLVQTYETESGEIWHADLYRLSGPDEVFELGLEEAMDTARCLIEWPERLAPDWPSSAVMLRFETDAADPDNGRVIGLWSDGDGPTLQRVLPAFSGRVEP